MVYELRVIHDSRNSFYGKARVRIEGDKKILISYSTEVAYIQNGKAVVNGHYSQTTGRHIREFLKQNGFEANIPFDKILEKYKEPKELEQQRKKEEAKRVNEQFSTVGKIAALGEIFANTPKEKNDWKARMLKAGLPGLSIPEDWDSLSEEEKEKRLNKVIEFSKGEVVK